MSAGAGCGERGCDFGGMVSVIVHDGLALCFVNDLEAAFGPTEAGECARNRLEGLSDFAGQRDCGEGVHSIVGTWDVQHDFAERLSILDHTEAGFEIFGGQVRNAVARLGAESVGNGMRV